MPLEPGPTAAVVRARETWLAIAAARAGSHFPTIGQKDIRNEVLRSRTEIGAGLRFSPPSSVGWRSRAVLSARVATTAATRHRRVLYTYTASRDRIVPRAGIGPEAERVR